MKRTLPSSSLATPANGRSPGAGPTTPTTCLPTSPTGTKRVSGYRLLENALNQRDTRVYDYYEEDGKKKRTLNRKETMLAQQKAGSHKGSLQKLDF